jgi:hypothetical protein
MALPRGVLVVDDVRIAAMACRDHYISDIFASLL